MKLVTTSELAGTAPLTKGSIVYYSSAKGRQAAAYSISGEAEGLVTLVPINATHRSIRVERHAVTSVADDSGPRFILPMDVFYFLFSGESNRSQIHACQLGSVVDDVYHDGNDLYCHVGVTLVDASGIALMLDVVLLIANNNVLKAYFKQCEPLNTRLLGNPNDYGGISNPASEYVPGIMSALLCPANHKRLISMVESELHAMSTASLEKSA